MKKAIVLTTILQLFVLVNFAQLKVQYLLTENLTNPIGLDVTQPRFSWQLIADNRRNVMQSAYEIMVSSPKGNVWKSGKVMSDSSVQVAYKGIALQSGTKYTWEVRVWDNSGGKTFCME
jgi:alpha-L-rhamnosidase